MARKLGETQINPVEYFFHPLIKQKRHYIETVEILVINYDRRGGKSQKMTVKFVSFEIATWFEK